MEPQNNEKKTSFSSPFLWGLEYLEGEWEKPLFTYSSFLHSLSGVDAKQTKTLKLYEHNIISNKE